VNQTISISKLPPNASTRKRVLIVNCYFDDTRRPIRRTTKVPQAMGPVYLAGAFDRETCDVRLYNELTSGPLEDPQLLGWPDLLVFTGLTNSFDRMLHLTAYAKTKNPRVIVVAGGPPVRQLPHLAAQFFDYCCLGDIEELCDIARAALGPRYVAAEMMPRFDLAYWITWLGHIESTRYCNFRCSFCALTGEGRNYQTYKLDYIRQQMLAVGAKKHVLFIDNNFYGSDRKHFFARLDLIKELRAEKRFGDWGCLVTNDFFAKQENLTKAREAGCELLFSGVESFDMEWLRACNKLQNTKHPQVEMISKCLESGIVFCYGLMVDPTSRRIADLRRELHFITGTPEITLPSFLTMSIPLLGTPYFYECLKNRAIYPQTKLRDMDGLTIMMEPLDGVAEVIKFLRSVEGMEGYRLRVVKHMAAFAKRYRKRLSKMQMTFALANAGIICVPDLTNSFKGAGWRTRRKQPRTFVSTTEPLDDQYTPKFRVDARFTRHFQPTMVTNECGELAEEMIESGLFKTVPAAVS
jgi:hypothetical protein